MYHSVNSAEINKSAVSRKSFHNAGINLTDLDIFPELDRSGLLFFSLDCANRAEKLMLGRINLENFEFDLIANNAGKFGCFRKSGERSGDEYLLTLTVDEHSSADGLFDLPGEYIA
ncbi:hypothetical protein SDC9_167203 [bioreactor metagenome]|uniref:Uncharacterized protein n=1 Tax=bioreactor metagenome TaxID=1076179 RepID=A0A645FZ58_9ZZZZ